MSMALDGTIMARARAEYAKENERRAAAFRRRCAELTEKLPELAVIDGRIRELMTETFRLALSGEQDVEQKVGVLAERSEALQQRRRDLLRENGYPADFLDEKYACEKCEDTGYVNMAPCECLMALYRREQSRELSSLDHLAGETFNTFSLSWYSPEKQGAFSPRERMKTVLEGCRAYAENFGPKSGSLLLTGGAGLGKTFLSACIARTVSEKGFSVAYQTAGESFAAYEGLRFGRTADPDAARDMLRRLEECDLLVLDDLGTEMTTAFTVACLYELVNTRLTSGKSTVISTNLDPSELAGRYSEQIASRINGEYVVLRFYGEDIRLQKRRMK